jgi:uncharacterized protein YegP (UPF0339 family)
MAGMMIDRIAKNAMQPPQSTVAQDVLGMAPTTGQMPPQGQMPPEAMQGQAPQGQPPQMPPQMAAHGGIMGMMPHSDGVAALHSNIPDYAGGGIIAFADRGAVKDPYQVEKANFRELDMPTDRTAQTEIARRDEMQKAFGFKPDEFFSQRATEATKEREKLKEREDDSARKAFIKGSLAAAAGKSRYALTNIAEGAVKGYESYEGEQKDLREQQRLLREIDRKDAEAKFLHQRGDVDAATKRMDEGEKLKMEVKAKNAEIFNKGEEYRAKAETEKGANVFKETEATKRTGMQTAAQKEIAQMPGDQQKMLMAIQAAEAKKNPDNPPSLLDVHTAVHSNTGKADARARASVAFAEKWNTASADVTGLKLANLKKESGAENVEDFVRKNMEIYDTYYPRGIQRSGAGNQPTGGATNALPMPASKADLKVGSTYDTPRGPAKWDGTNFVQ